MTRSAVLVWVMAALQAMASLSFAVERRWPQAFYWLACLLITLAVVWMSMEAKTWPTTTPSTFTT